MQGLAKIWLGRVAHSPAICSSVSWSAWKGGRRVRHWATHPPWRRPPAPAPSAGASFIRCTCWLREEAARGGAWDSQDPRVRCRGGPGRATTTGRLKKHPASAADLLQSQPGRSACSVKVSLREPQRLRQAAAALEASSSALEGSKAKQASSPWVGRRKLPTAIFASSCHLVGGTRPGQQGSCGNISFSWCLQVVPGPGRTLVGKGCSTPHRQGRRRAPFCSAGSDCSRQPGAQD